MTHDSIAAEDVIARYTANRLSPDEEREFDAHLVDCPVCCEQVEQELSFRDGLLATVADRKLTSPVAPLWSTSRWVVAAAAVVLAVAGALAIALSRTSTALDMALADGQAQQQRADEAARTAQQLERRIADIESQMRQPSATSTSQAATAFVPTTVFALTAIRGGAADARNINRFTFDPGQPPAVVVLTVDMPPGEYALTLKAEGGREVWSGGRFRPSSQDVLSVAVDAKVLTAGQYTLEVHRLGGDSPATLAARYPFEVSSR